MPDELVYVVTGIDHAGIDHRLETKDAYEAQQHHIKILGMARDAERREQNWQLWPDIEGRPVLGAPKLAPQSEQQHGKPVRFPSKQKKLPYSD